MVKQFFFQFVHIILIWGKAIPFVMLFFNLISEKPARKRKESIGKAEDSFELSISCFQKVSAFLIIPL